MKTSCSDFVLVQPKILNFRKKKTSDTKSMQVLQVVHKTADF